MGIPDSGQCDWRVLRSLDVKDLFCRYRVKRVGPSQPLQKTYFLFPTLHTSTVAVKCHCPGSAILPSLPRECHSPAIAPGVPFPRHCPGSAIPPSLIINFWYCWACSWPEYGWIIDHWTLINKQSNNHQPMITLDGLWALFELYSLCLCIFRYVSLSLFCVNFLRSCQSLLCGYSSVFYFVT
jgi:hypothetical protein